MPRTLQTSFTISGGQAYSVLAFREVHRLGVPARLEIDILLPVYLDIEQMVGQPCGLQYGFDGGDTRAFTGVAESVTVEGSGAVAFGHTYQYSLVVVSPLSFLAGNYRCLIQQDVTVQDAVTAVLADAAPDLVTEWRLKGTYPKRPYCVQYQETDLAYVSRLLEEEGIHHFYEVGSDGTGTLILSDDSTAAKPIDGDATLNLRAFAVNIDVDAIREISERQLVTSGKFVLRDYNYEKPQVDMTATAAGSAHTDLEVYDYPGGYLEVSDGNRLAKLRLERAQAEISTLGMQVECVRVSVGRKLTVAGSGATDGDWVVTAATHEYARDHAEGQNRHYSCEAEVLPAKTPFRPPLVTPRPVIQGPQTAVIVCPAGSQAEEIHTDKNGCCKVAFNWDLSGIGDDKATAWMRVSQLQTSGSMLLPRMGWEVVVEFLEGDPDRPIVTGRLYNGLFMPPYALPEGKTRTSIKTVSSPGGGGANEIRMEDKSGSEEIMMHSQKDTNVAVANNKTKNVGNNETLVVGADSMTTVGADQTVKITKGSKNGITGNQVTIVGGTRSLEVNAVAAWNVTGNSTTAVGGGQSEQIGNPLEALIALAVAKAAEIAAAHAAAAIAAVQGAVQGKIDQALGPVADLAGRADQLGAGLNALGSGDVSALGGVVAGATGMPAIGAVASAMGGGGGGGGGGAGGDGAGGGGIPSASGAVSGVSGQASALNIAASNMVSSAVGNAIQSAASQAVAGLDAAAGVDAGGGGSTSLGNTGGPAGAVPGVDQTDRTKGPGHSTYAVKGNHKETVGAIKVLATLTGINTNVGGDMTQKGGAAIVQMAYGDVAEAVTGSKNEKELGLVVVAKGESEHVKGSKMAMIGGLVLDKVSGNQSLESGANVTLVGALHKIEASTGITLKCGESEVVINGDGIAIKSLMVTFTAAKIQLPKPAGEGG